MIGRKDQHDSTRIPLCSKCRRNRNRQAESWRTSSSTISVQLRFREAVRHLVPRSAVAHHRHLAKRFAKAFDCSTAVHRVLPKPDGHIRCARSFEISPPIPGENQIERE
jgi:hypothetical protein